MSTLTSRWPPVPLPFARGQNEEPGLSELLAQTAANSATLWGHTNGGQLVGDVANPAPLNPSGDHGHDHSGGDFGKALFRSLLTVTFDDGEVYNPTEIQGGVNYGVIPVADAADSVINYGQHHRWVAIWVPPCDPLTGAYVDLGVHVAARLQTTALLAGDTLQLQAWRKRSDTSAANTLVSFTLPNPNSTGDKRAESGSRLSVIPGALNLIYFRVRVERTTGGAVRGCTLAIKDIEIGVYET